MICDLFYMQIARVCNILQYSLKLANYRVLYYFELKGKTKHYLQTAFHNSFSCPGQRVAPITSCAFLWCYFSWVDKISSHDVFSVDAIGLVRPQGRQLTTQPPTQAHLKWVWVWVRGCRQLCWVSFFYLLLFYVIRPNANLYPGTFFCDDCQETVSGL